MERADFLSLLSDEGYSEVATVEREAHGSIDLHAHPFEAKALILNGEIRLRIGEAEQVFRAGEVFHLRANEPHRESYGPDGVIYLVGRKNSAVTPS
ncbi:cupin domain-containing protein [Noviherbaspirillum sp. CPCC 100848]|uniref:Cupin domain-containing protein n=1 Tax=Noviherbaspirillum album TaxID=3080276 RepID=A0ABU6JB31_9BURK|nr:cupin domain-containing protein [Noviherbaspirillum sp. CPCC 100848]MEC4720841.1 cupin domain-containing protein [Noviherbaspirillum sp. CPCC 100848]